MYIHTEQVKEFRAQFIIVESNKIETAVNWLASRWEGRQRAKVGSIR